MPANFPQIKIGADPELFVKHKETGKFVSAHNLIPGTKAKPYPVPGGAIQVDGVAAEFNIEPATNYEQFTTNIQMVMDTMKIMMPEHELVIAPAVVFDKDYFLGLPEDVRQLGCNPDFNAWTGLVNPAPDGAATTMRTASGHIHIGWEEGQDVTDPYWMEDCFEVVKQLDYYLGATSLLWDNDKRRRDLYGKAGACRIKPYGVEYRTPSNRWLINKTLQQHVYWAAFYAIHGMLGGNKVRMADKFGDMARVLIDTGNSEGVMSNSFRTEVYNHTELNWPKW